jgi:hypothetical protein
LPVGHQNIHLAIVTQNQAMASHVVAARHPAGPNQRSRIGNNSGASNGRYRIGNNSGAWNRRSRIGNNSGTQRGRSRDRKISLRLLDLQSSGQPLKKSSAPISRPPQVCRFTRSRRVARLSR